MYGGGSAADRSDWVCELITVNLTPFPWTDSANLGIRYSSDHWKYIELGSKSIWRYQIQRREHPEHNNMAEWVTTKTLASCR
jgi:hypothetical protein